MRINRLKAYLFVNHRTILRYKISIFVAKQEATNLLSGLFKYSLI